MIAQGYVRNTEDLDICYERSGENVERLARVLQRVHARPREWPEDAPFILDAQTILNGDTLTLETDFGPLDVMGTPDGTRGFEDLARSQQVFELGDTLRVAVASVPDLLRMKRASARTPHRASKDLADIEALEAIRREQETRPRETT